MKMSALPTIWQKPIWPSTQTTFLSACCCPTHQPACNIHLQTWCTISYISNMWAIGLFQLQRDGWMDAFCPDTSDYGKNLFKTWVTILTNTASIISYFMYSLCCKMLPPRPQIQMHMIVSTLHFLHRTPSELTHRTIYIQSLFTCLYFSVLIIYIKHVLKFKYFLFKWNCQPHSQ